MLEPVAVNVNGKSYTVNPFGPTEAFSYLHALIYARATGQGIGALGMKALHKCLTPEDRSLEDEDYFHSWFTEHPTDLLELESAAMDALVEPWESGASNEERLSSVVQELIKRMGDSSLDGILQKVTDAYEDSVSMREIQRINESDTGIAKRFGQSFKGSETQG